MKWLILLLLTPLAWGDNGHGHNHQSDTGASSTSGSGATSSSNAISQSDFTNFLYVDASQPAGVVGSDRSINIEHGDYPASSAAAVRVSYCSGGLSLQGKSFGMSIGETESVCIKKAIRAVTINEMYRQTRLGNHEKVAEYNIKIIKLVDDMHYNEDARNWAERIWIWTKIAVPFVLAAAATR